jgi:hypothetical protein
MLEFTTFSDLISVETNVLMSEEEATRKLNAESIVVWRELAGSITSLLTKSNLTWYHVQPSGYRLTIYRFVVIV